MKTKLFAALLTLVLLLTACSVQGTSSATSHTPTDSSKAEVTSSAGVSDKPGTSSDAISSNNSVSLMSYKEYFSTMREIKMGTHFQVDDYGYLRDGARYVIPFKPYGQKFENLRLYAVTNQEVLMVFADRVYSIKNIDELAEVVYEGEEGGYYPVLILPCANEYVFFVLNRCVSDPTKLQICRVFRPTGKVDILATEKDITGVYTDMWVESNHMLLVESYVPYESNPNWTEDEAGNAWSEARRMILIDTFNKRILSSDSDEYTEALEEWRKKTQMGESFSTGSMNAVN